MTTQKRKQIFNALLGSTVLLTSIQATAAEYLPNIERREVVTPGIDTENFEISTFMSLLSVQDFSVEPHFSVRLAYHAHENWFFEGSLGQADIGASAMERSFNGTGGISNLETVSDRRYTDYHFNVGWNFLQGQTSYLGKKSMINSTYLTAGAGITNFADQNNMTINFGIGQRLLFNDNLAFRVEAKDYVVSYDNPPGGTKSSQHNLSIGVGLGLFF